MGYHYWRVVDPSTLLIGSAASILTYIGGVLSKPLQSWIDERRERNNLRKALYVEMARLLSKYYYLIEELRRDPSLRNYWEAYITDLTTSQCFELAKAKPIVLNLLPDFVGINHFFTGLENLSVVYQKMLNDNRPMSFFTVIFLMSVMGTVKIIEDGELSIDELRRFGDGKAKKLLDGIPDIRELVNEFRLLSQAEPPPPPSSAAQTPIPPPR